jgi:hypothetical protein
MDDQRFEIVDLIAQQRVDDAVPLDPAAAAETRRDDGGGVLAAIAAQVGDCYIAVRQPLTDQPVYFIGIERHVESVSFPPADYNGLKESQKHFSARAGK